MLFRIFRKLFDALLRPTSRTAYCPDLLASLADRYTTISLWSKLTGRSFSALRRLIIRRGVQSVGVSVLVNNDARTAAKLYRVGELSKIAPLPPSVTNTQLLMSIREAQPKE